MNKLNKKIVIDWATLLRFCQIRDFTRMAEEYGAVAVGGKAHDTWFIDRGKRAKVLAVAHFDTVYRGKGPAPAKLLRAMNTTIGIQSIQLDDRLGAYIILEMLPALGIDVDVLITTDEEIGRSTAQYFTSEKKYNWIFSFDRRGILPVLYDYESDKNWLAAVTEIATPAWGTYSDICYLDTLGVCGVNWGTGYNQEHSPNCWAVRSDIELVVASFAKFYFRNFNKRYEYEDTYFDRDDDYNWGRYWNNYDSKRGSQNRTPAVSARALLGKPKSSLDWVEHRMPDHRYVGDSKTEEYLCEFCWSWHEKLEWDSTYKAWLCDFCHSCTPSGRRWWDEVNSNMGG